MFVDSGVLSVDVNDIGIFNMAISLEYSQNFPREDVSFLLTKAFLRCCELLPKQIKKMLRTKDSADASAVDSFLGILSSLIEKANIFDKNIIALESNIIDKCLTSCLKYGMMELHDEMSCLIFGGCLKVIRLIMRTSHGPSSTVVLGRLTPSQVHAMAVSHSSFHRALARARPRSESAKGSPMSTKCERKFCAGLSQQSELIRLLLCTVSHDAGHVKIESETWTVVLSVYNASTEVVDRLLRRLMFLYEQNRCCQDEVCINFFSVRCLKTLHRS